MMGLFIIMEFLLELNAREADCPTYQEAQSASLAFNSRKTSRNSNMKNFQNLSYKRPNTILYIVL